MSCLRISNGTTCHHNSIQQMTPHKALMGKHCFSDKGGRADQAFSATQTVSGHFNQFLTRSMTRSRAEEDCVFLCEKGGKWDFTQDSCLFLRLVWVVEICCFDALGCERFAAFFEQEGQLWSLDILIECWWSARFWDDYSAVGSGKVFCFGDSIPWIKQWLLYKEQ